MDSKPDPERLAMVAREAETQGFHSVWVPDHVLRLFGPILDPLTVLTFVAGVTERIALGTNVLVLPYRHPLILANEAASLDALSGGRRPERPRDLTDAPGDTGMGRGGGSAAATVMAQ
jgi:alkanesulfonate monooxygenase SsuD/methylene tetrahydromethanopterin reductase-like flavin-dependent oxidoreductase (luciferase family)